MPDVAPRYPCPSCLGVKLHKVVIGGDRRLVLDYCRRCGGMWFEHGEVQQLRARDPRALWDQIARRAAPSRSACHNCHAWMDRNVGECPACGWLNRIDCPVCARPMIAQRHENLRLDVCAACKGVWFDHEELAAIWKLSLDASLVRRPAGAAADAADTGGHVLLGALVYSPDLVFYGAHAAGFAVHGTAQELAHAPELLSGAVEGAGAAAEGIFGVIASIFEGLFS